MESHFTGLIFLIKSIRKLQAKRTGNDQIFNFDTNSRKINERQATVMMTSCLPFFYLGTVTFFVLFSGDFYFARFKHFHFRQMHRQNTIDILC
jgi:hypothetical protein